MTGKSHRLTALAFGSALVSLMVMGYVVPPYPNTSPFLVAAVWMAGIITGASAPDWLEIVIHTKNTRRSLIPHRTLTHWPVIWLAAAYYVWTIHFPWIVESFLFGFIASGLLHIAMDSLSSSGIPLLLPFASFRVKLPLYRTGRISEFFMSVLIIGAFSGISYLALTANIGDIIATLSLDSLL